MTHPEQEALSVSEVLSRAADLLEKPGAWTQWAYGRDIFGDVEEDGSEMPTDPVCFCVQGAIGQVMGERPYGAPIYPVIGALADHLGVPAVDVPVWNDAPGRTQAEVVSALRAASEASQ